MLLGNAGKFARAATQTVDAGDHVRITYQRRRAVAGGESGFTYLGLLAAIVVIAIGLAAASPVARTMQMRDKERELLFVGDQFRRAIAAYYEKTPGPLKQAPRSLEQLLKDDRYPDVQRYLRRIYADPITGKKEWGLVDIPGRGIVGVYSLSNDKPVRTANFPTRYKDFAGKDKYSDWKFVYVPGAPQTPSANSPGMPVMPTAPSQ